MHKALPVGHLIRLLEQPDGCTLGRLLLDGMEYQTLEPPLRNNKPFISCIPEGSYKCVRHVSPRFGETFEVTGVSGRDNILFHSGNVASDTSGCILLGLDCGRLHGLPAVLSSRDAVRRFLDQLNEVHAWWLNIRGEKT